MADVNPPGAVPNTVAETYCHRDNPAIEAWTAERAAAGEAAFFLLRPGMRVLDVGCGPGDHPGARRMGQACTTTCSKRQSRSNPGR